MAMYKLHYGTQAQYDAKKAAGALVQDDLYFTSDTALIYKGDMLLSAAVEAVEQFPATGAQGRIYVDTNTLEAKVWNGTAWVVVSPAVETTLTADTATGALVTAGAIRSYIESQVGSGGVVKDVAYDSAAQKLTLTYGDNKTKELLLKDLITNVEYDGATGKFTFTRANNATPIEVTTPVENFLSAAAYNAETHELELTLESGDVVKVNLEDLIDVYTVKSSKSVALAMNGNEITADVVLSTDENNQLVLKENGLFVAKTDLSGYYTKAEVDTKVKEVDDKVTALDTRVTAAEGEIDKIQEQLGDAKLADYYTKVEVDALLSWQEI